MSKSDGTVGLHAHVGRQARRGGAGKLDGGGHGLVGQLGTVDGQQDVLGGLGKGKTEEMRE